MVHITVMTVILLLAVGESEASMAAKERHRYLMRHDAHTGQVTTVVSPAISPLGDDRSLNVVKEKQKQKDKEKKNDCDKKVKKTKSPTVSPAPSVSPRPSLSPTTTVMPTTVIRPSSSPSISFSPTTKKQKKFAERKTKSPTVSPAPTTSRTPTGSPSVSSNPTMTPQPTDNPTRCMPTTSPMPSTSEPPTSTYQVNCRELRFGIVKAPWDANIQNFQNVKINTDVVLTNGVTAESIYAPLQNGLQLNVSPKLAGCTDVQVQVGPLLVEFTDITTQSSGRRLNQCPGDNTCVSLAIGINAWVLENDDSGSRRHLTELNQDSVLSAIANAMNEAISYGSLSIAGLEGMTAIPPNQSDDSSLSTAGAVAVAFAAIGVAMVALFALHKRRRSRAHKSFDEDVFLNPPGTYLKHRSQTPSVLEETSVGSAGLEKGGMSDLNKTIDLDDSSFLDSPDGDEIIDDLQQASPLAPADSQRLETAFEAENGLDPFTRKRNELQLSEANNVNFGDTTFAAFEEEDFIMYKSYHDARSCRSAKCELCTAQQKPLRKKERSSTHLDHDPTMMDEEDSFKDDSQSIGQRDYIARDTIDL